MDLTAIFSKANIRHPLVHEHGRNRMLRWLQRPKFGGPIDTRCDQSFPVTTKGSVCNHALVTEQRPGWRRITAV